MDYSMCSTQKSSTAHDEASDQNQIRLAVDLPSKNINSLDEFPDDDKTQSSVDSQQTPIGSLDESICIDDEENQRSNSATGNEEDDNVFYPNFPPEVSQHKRTSPLTKWSRKTGDTPVQSSAEQFGHADCDNYSEEKESAEGVIQQSALSHIHLQSYKELLVSSYDSKETPRIFITPEGTITIFLERGVLVELTINKNIRICVLDHLAITSCRKAKGAINAIYHPKAQIYQDGYHMLAKTSSSHFMQFKDYEVIIWHSTNATGSWKVSQQAVIVSVDIPEVRFRDDEDISVRAFYDTAKYGLNQIAECQRQVANARYSHNKLTNDLTVWINGIHITQTATSGQVAVVDAQRALYVSPISDSVSIHTRWCEMAVDDYPNGQIQMKRGIKRIHSSNSGIVVSNGHVTAAFDKHLSLIAYS